MEVAVLEESNAISAGHLEKEVPPTSTNAAYYQGHRQEIEEKEAEPGLRDRGSFGRSGLGFGRAKPSARGRVRARDDDAELTPKVRFLSSLGVAQDRE